MLYVGIEIKKRRRKLKNIVWGSCRTKRPERLAYSCHIFGGVKCKLLWQKHGYYCTTCHASFFQERNFQLSCQPKTNIQQRKSAKSNSIS
jgi:hypothetical protein